MLSPPRKHLNDKKKILLVFSKFFLIALTNSTLFASSLIQKRGISLLAFWKEYTSFFLPSCYNKEARVFFQSKVTSSVDNMDSSLPFLSSTFCCGISLPLFGILFLSTDLPHWLWKQVSIPFLLQTKIKSNSHLFLNYFLFHLLPYLLSGKSCYAPSVSSFYHFLLFSQPSPIRRLPSSLLHMAPAVSLHNLCQKSNRYSPFFNLLDFSLKFC